MIIWFAFCFCILNPGGANRGGEGAKEEDSSVLTISSKKSQGLKRNDNNNDDNKKVFKFYKSWQPYQRKVKVFKFYNLSSAACSKFKTSEGVVKVQAGVRLIKLSTTHLINTALALNHQ